MQAVKQLQEKPDLGAYRIHTALLQQSINLSPRTCGRAEVADADVVVDDMDGIVQAVLDMGR